MLREHTSLSFPAILVILPSPLDVIDVSSFIVQGVGSCTGSRACPRNAATAARKNTSYLLVVEAADAHFGKFAALLLPVVFSSFQKVVASWYIQKLPLGQGVALQVQM